MFTKEIEPNFIVIIVYYCLLIIIQNTAFANWSQLYNYATLNFNKL